MKTEDLEWIPLGMNGGETAYICFMILVVSAVILALALVLRVGGNSYIELWQKLTVTIAFIVACFLLPTPVGIAGNHIRDRVDQAGAEAVQKNTENVRSWITSEYGADISDEEAGRLADAIADSSDDGEFAVRSAKGPIRVTLREVDGEYALMSGDAELKLTGNQRLFPAGSN